MWKCSGQRRFQVCKWYILVFKKPGCRKLQNDIIKWSEWISVTFCPGNGEREGGHGHSHTSLGDVEFHQWHLAVVAHSDTVQEESWFPWYALRVMLWKLYSQSLLFFEALDKRNNSELRGILKKWSSPFWELCVGRWIRSVCICRGWRCL